MAYKLIFVLNAWIYLLLARRFGSLADVFNDSSLMSTSPDTGRSYKPIQGYLKARYRLIAVGQLPHNNIRNCSHDDSAERPAVSIVIRGTLQE